MAHSNSNSGSATPAGSMILITFTGTEAQQRRVVAAAVAAATSVDPDAGLWEVDCALPERIEAWPTGTVAEGTEILARLEKANV